MITKVNKYKVLVILMLLTQYVYSQTYRQIFDAFDSNVSGLSFFNHNFKNNNINGPGTKILQAYLNMFKATKDLKYLDKFIIAAKRIQDRRDDNIANTSFVLELPYTYTHTDENGVTTSCTISDLNSINTSSKGWSRFNNDACVVANCYKTQFFKESAEICIPMAEFIYIIKKDYPDLLNYPLPEEVDQGQNTQNYYSPYSVTNLGEFIAWLEHRIEETILWHNGNYKDLSSEQKLQKYAEDHNLHSSYTYFEEEYPGCDLNTGGVNQQLYMGVLSLWMYEISVLKGTPNADYFSKVSRMLYEFIYHINDGDGLIGNSQPSTPDGGSCYVWCHKYDCGGNFWEDIGHGVIDMQFADLCYQFGIPNSSNGGTLGLNEMKKFANTFAYHLVDKPLHIHKNVAGGDTDCDQCDQPNDRLAFITAEYVFLAKYNPQIFQIASDFYAPDNIYNFDIDGAPALLGYSNLVYYESVLPEKIFNPIAVKRSTNIAGGPYYNPYNYGESTGNYTKSNGANSFISSKIFHDSGGQPILSLLEEHFLDNTNTILSNIVLALPSSELIALSNGQIDPNTSSEEIVAIDKKNDELKIFQILNDGSINNIFQITSSSLGVLIGATLSSAVEDFIPGIPGEEILITSVQSGNVVFKLFSFNNSLNLLTEIPIINSSIGTFSIPKFTTGNFSGTGDAQIAVYENATNQITVYKIVSGNTLQQVASGSINTPGETWKGITSGDFDGDGVDEMMLYQENAAAGRFQIFRVSASGTVDLKAQEYFPVNQGNGVMCSMRLENYPQSDALITFRNYDGQISIFNMEGLCPGLNLNNQTLDANSTFNYPNLTDPAQVAFDNNFTIDYHVHSTLIAGNGFEIKDPSIVDMSSGKEIIFKPGFTAQVGSDVHAYISPALECNPNSFRRSNPSNIPVQPEQETVQPAKKSNGNLSIVPNPTTGIFNVTITRNNAPVDIKEVAVYDMMGRTVWKNTNGGTNSFSIDITDYSAGIYYIRSINIFGEPEIQKFIKN